MESGEKSGNAMKYISLILSVLIILSGCSGSSGHNPVTDFSPELQGNPEIQNTTVNPGNRALLGYWNIKIDPESMDVEILPVRTVQRHFNALIGLEKSPCSACLSISNPHFVSGNTIGVDVTIRHPFDSNPLFSVFDVRGIFITRRDYNYSPVDAWFRWIDSIDISLQNYDGYTNLFNYYDDESGSWYTYIEGKFATEFTRARLNPFIAFGKDNPRRMFSPGTEETEQYNLKALGGSLEFAYAVDASWELPSLPVTDPLTDFSKNANTLEPYQISATVGDGINSLIDSSAKVTVEIYDYQGVSTFHEVQMYCGTVNSKIITLEFSSVSEDGGFIYEGTMTNIKGWSGLQPLLVVVTDTNPDPVLGELKAFNIFPLVLSVFIPPTPVAEVDHDTASICDTLYFSAYNSYDFNGDLIQQIEWDFENDGIYDASGVDVTHNFDTVGEHEIQVKATDDSGLSGYLEQPLIVNITDPAPEASAVSDKNYIGTGVDIFFDASDSLPDNCVNEIISYEWDWENDGSIDDMGVTASHSWTDAGNYDVQLRVTGSNLVSDLLDNPIHIDVDSGVIPPIALAQADKYVVLAGEEINFQDAGSYDPDGGSLSLFDWDWENDGVFDESGMNVTHAWVEPGTYEVQYRVMDDELEPASLDLPLVIQVNSQTGYSIAIGDYGNDSCYELTKDEQGNIYLSGVFEGTVDFDPGPGIFNLSTDSITSYILKLDKYRNFQWAARNSGYENSHLLEVYDESPVLMNVAPTTGRYVTRYSSDGTKIFTGHIYTAVTEFKFDQYGNIYVCGVFTSNNDFDPGTGQLYINSNQGSNDAFLMKLNPDMTISWIRTWGSSHADYCTDLEITDDGRILVLGYFTEECDFDPGPSVNLIKSEDYQDGFIVTFNPSGQFESVVILDPIPTAMELDSSGNFLLTGESGILDDFDPGPDVYHIENSEQYNQFVWKLNSSFQFQWVYDWNHYNNAQVMDFEVDPYGNLYMSGFIYGEVDLDPGPEWQIVDPYDRAAFIRSYDSSGNYKWTRTWGEVTFGRSDGGLYAGDNEILMAGYFKDFIDFDPSGNNDWKVPKGLIDGFLVVLTAEGVY
jgi:PKD repeat protein